MGAASRLPRMAPTSLRMDRLAVCQNTYKETNFSRIWFKAAQNNVNAYSVKIT